MCGQAGIYRRTTRPIPKLGALANELLLSIEQLGKDATGILALHDSGRYQLERKVTPASRFVRKRQRFDEHTRTLLLHTRFATVGARDDVKNAHPQVSGPIAATHNGTIRNAGEVFRAFDLPRQATVDSEVIPALIDYAGWEHMDEALTLLEGGAAIAVVNSKRPTEVVLARLRSFPLHYTVTKDAIVWASTRQAIERAWYRAYGRTLRAKVHTLEEGDIVRINGNAKPGRIAGRKPEVWTPPARRTRATTRTYGQMTLPETTTRRKDTPSTAELMRMIRDLEDRVAFLEDELAIDDYDYDDRKEEDEELEWLDDLLIDGTGGAIRATKSMSPATRAWYELDD